MSTFKLNGTQPSPRNWRDQIVNDTLKADIYYDGAESDLLRAIRQRHVGCATLSFWPDRTTLTQFLHEQTSELRSLLAGSSSYHNARGESIEPLLGWYGFVWQNAALEIVFAPGTHRTEAICIAPDEEILQRFSKALFHFLDQPLGRCLRYSQTWESAPDLDAEIGKVTWDDIVLPEPTLEGVRDAVEGFFKHREAFSALGFPWKRGILLIGPPGTGKTMVCKAAAAALPELPFLYVRDLRAERGNEAMQTIFERARRLAPCILAFEDIDGLVDELNRTIFLNELDGFGNNEGLLVIASSNHPGRIDEALLKRPSRFDRVFHLGLPALPERRIYCERLLHRSTLTERLDAAVDWPALAQQVAEQSDGFTPAYLKEAFLSAALQRAQVGAMALDQEFADAVLAQTEELRQHLKRLKDPEALAVIRSGDDNIGLRR